MVNVRKWVHLLGSGMQVGDGRVNKGEYGIGWKQCFNLLIYLFIYLFIFTEFIGVTLVNAII